MSFLFQRIRTITMKTALILLLGFILLIPISLSVLGYISKTGKAPGLVDNKLSRCPDKPNCVCSEYSDQGDHYIKPITLNASNPISIEQLKAIIAKMKGQIVDSEQSNSKDYIAATFTSSLYGFVDDFEVRLDPQNAIQVRSASRVGRSDLGVNRKRVETFESLVTQLQK